MSNLNRHRRAKRDWWGPPVARNVPCEEAETHPMIEPIRRMRL